MILVIRARGSVLFLRISAKGRVAEMPIARNFSDEFIKIKHRGKIFTPDYLVNIILDRGHYDGFNILKKHVIDNSCGDGQFMIKIVDRYCREFLQNSSDLSALKTELETYIHAIEIEKDDLDVCKHRCDEVALIYGVKNVAWDFINDDALRVHKYDNRMDFVIGNPPYVRIHNLGDSLRGIKNRLFTKSGMTDLYIVFYEIGLQMLSSKGILSYITPSSFFTSIAGKEMRDYFVKHNLIESLCDLKHFQAFSATTYTTIVCLKKGRVLNSVQYDEFDSTKLLPFNVSKLNPQDFYINGCFYFSDKRRLMSLSRILKCTKKANFAVKNGYATLADKVFIREFDFKSNFIIPVLKASCAKWTKAFFPYDRDGHLVSEDVISGDKNLYNYLLANKNTLLNRSNENKSENYWYAFGRSQGINDTYKDKLSLNALIRTTDDLKLIDVPSGSGVYSGFYIISDTVPYYKIKKALLKAEFCDYVSMLGKYKSGGYYTFSSRDVTNYLNYELTREKDKNA